MNNDEATSNPSPHRVLPQYRECEQHAQARRRISLGLGALCAALLATPALRFLLGPLFKPDEHVWRRVGRATDFAIGETTSVTFLDPSPLVWAGVTARTAAWLRRVSETEFVAFAINCSHLGCPVRWDQQAELFMCPCHGGVYYLDGQVAAGPPPMPLARYAVRINHGDVELRTEPTRIT